MASTSSPNAEDNFICSICLDVFTNPVTIPRGHNYCLDCILLHWESRDAELQELEEYDKRQMLQVNTFIAQLIADIRNQQEMEKCFMLSALGRSITAALCVLCCIVKSLWSLLSKFQCWRNTS